MVVAVVGALGASACSGGAKVHDAATLRRALFGPADVGNGFRVTRPQPDDNSLFGGSECRAASRKFNSLDPQRTGAPQAQRAFTNGKLTVEEMVTSTKGMGGIVSAMRAMASACSTFRADGMAGTMDEVAVSGKATAALATTMVSGSVTATALVMVVRRGADGAFISVTPESSLMEAGKADLDARDYQYLLDKAARRLESLA
ncbi:MAG: hypothetical protein HYX34_06200 [Actinobacteria bacterium]|nr:hypothetical protein [Actinomycetota bacterium]